MLASCAAPTAGGDPWALVPDTAPFVLAVDHKMLEGFRPRSSSHKIRSNVLPEPYVGNPGAGVVLLGLNPGFSEKDVEAHANGPFAKRLRQNPSFFRLRNPRCAYLTRRNCDDFDRIIDRLRDPQCVS